MPQPPAPRPMQDWQAAEAHAVRWMKYLGHADAKATPPGADQGLDAVARGAVAQVKAWMKPVGRADLQRLIGAAHGRDGVALYFFTIAGYSKPAVDLANEIGMRLYSLKVESGSLVPHSHSAQADLDSAVLTETLLAATPTSTIGPYADLSRPPIKQPSPMNRSQTKASQKMSKKLTKLAAKERGRDTRDFLEVGVRVKVDAVGYRDKTWMITKVSDRNVSVRLHPGGRVSWPVPRRKVSRLWM